MCTPYPVFSNVNILHYRDTFVKVKKTVSVYYFWLNTSFHPTVLLLFQDPIQHNKLYLDHTSFLFLVSARHSFPPRMPFSLLDLFSKVESCLISAVLFLIAPILCDFANLQLQNHLCLDHIFGIRHTVTCIIIYFLYFVCQLAFVLFWDRVLLCHPERSAVEWSQLTATSAFRVQTIFLPQPPK